MGKPWTAKRPGRRSESEFARSILTAVPEAVIVLDEAGRVVEMNPAAERMLGIPHADAAEHGLPVALPGGDDGLYTVQATRADGTGFSADVTSRAVELTDGTRLRVLYVRDPGQRPRGSRAALDLAAIVGLVGRCDRVDRAGRHHRGVEPGGRGGCSGTRRTRSPGPQSASVVDAGRPRRRAGSRRSRPRARARRARVESRRRLG